MHDATQDTERRRRGRLGAAILAIAVIGALVLPSAILAAKGGRGGGTTTTSSLALVVLDGDDTIANHNERVTFRATQSATDRPFVGVRCWQGTNFVYDGYTGLFDSYMFDPWVTLGSDYWADGVEASCTARLFYFDRRGREKTLSTLTFPALP